MIKAKTNRRSGIVSDIMPDLTSLIDVMFMLVLFLILTANTASYVISVDVPTDKDAVSEVVKDDEVIAVTLLPDNGGWLIGSQEFKQEDAFHEALLAQIDPKNEKQKVAIIGDKTVSMQKLVDMMTFLQKNNVPMADIAVER